MSAARRRWAAGMIGKAAGLEIPEYGSPQWLALPEGNLAKVASVIRAAECWARAGDELEADLRAEVEEARKAHKRHEDAEYVAGIASHREKWRGLSVVRGAYADQAEFRDGGRPA